VVDFITIDDPRIARIISGTSREDFKPEIREDSVWEVVVLMAQEFLSKTSSSGAFKLNHRTGVRFRENGETTRFVGTDSASIAIGDFTGSGMNELALTSPFGTGITSIIKGIGNLDSGDPYELPDAMKSGRLDGTIIDGGAHRVGDGMSLHAVSFGKGKGNRSHLIINMPFPSDNPAFAPLRDVRRQTEGGKESTVLLQHGNFLKSSSFNLQTLLSGDSNVRNVLKQLGGAAISDLYNVELSIANRLGKSVVFSSKPLSNKLRISQMNITGQNVSCAERLSLSSTGYTSKIDDFKIAAGRLGVTIQYGRSGSKGFIVIGSPGHHIGTGGLIYLLPLSAF